jgi:hypothetical protein
MKTGSPGWTSLGDHERTVACNCSAAATGAITPPAAATENRAKAILLVSVILGTKRIRLCYAAPAVFVPPSGAGSPLEDEHVFVSGWVPCKSLVTSRSGC